MNTLDDFKSKLNTKGFLDDEIMNMAENLGKEFKGITTTKMRQYFEDIKGLRRIIESQAAPEQIKVKLHLIRSRIAYDSGRDKKLALLQDFLNYAIKKALENKDVIKTTKEFTIFFENLYGYFYSSR